jgi:hypothetical protein
MRRLDGDNVILGIAGKIGVTLGMAAVRAVKEAGVKKRIFGVSRFSTRKHDDVSRMRGSRRFPPDLLDRNAVEALPDARNIVFMAGKKFGTGGAEETTGR